MRLLLDTHIFLWALEGSHKLPAEAARLITNPDNAVFVSSVSIWETAIKVSLGKLPMRGSLPELLQAALSSGFQALSFSHTHAAAVVDLPDLHADPFDRALVAQSTVEPMHLLTHDRQVARYRGNTLLV